MTIDYHEYISKEILLKYIPENPVIIDAGAFDGLDSIEFAQLIPDSTIYSFEPNPYLFVNIIQASKIYKNIIPLNYALGEFDGETNLYIPNMKCSSFSSLMKPDINVLGDFNDMVVKCITLNTFINQYNINKIDFMWLDLNGSEYKILQHADCVLRKTTAIYVEYLLTSLYEDIMLYNDFVKFMDNLGFEEVLNETHLNEHGGGNSLFINNNVVQENLNKNIYFLWATVRPKMMLETYNLWMNNRTQDSNIITKVAVLTEQQKLEIDSFNLPNCEVIVVNEKVGVNYATYVLTSNLMANDEDIVFIMSDDFHCPIGWDEYVMNRFKNWYGAIFLNDGRQDLTSKEHVYFTLPCLTYECMLKLNRIVYNPCYFHYFSDYEALDILKELNLIVDDREEDKNIFLHQCIRGNHREKDEYDNLNLGHELEDKTLYEERKKLSINERLQYVL